jgi:uncharacterized protein YegP (UPF0339 family)
MKAVRHLVLTLALAGAVGVAGSHFAAAQEKKAKDKDTKGVATFELYKDAGKKYRFRFKDAEGVTLAIAPHGYESRADCQKVVEAIRTSAARAKVTDAPTK